MFWLRFEKNFSSLSSYSFFICSSNFKSFNKVFISRWYQLYLHHRLTLLIFKYDYVESHKRHVFLLMVLFLRYNFFMKYQLLYLIFFILFSNYIIRNFWYVLNCFHQSQSAQNNIEKSSGSDISISWGGCRLSLFPLMNLVSPASLISHVGLAG